MFGTGPSGFTTRSALDHMARAKAGWDGCEWSTKAPELGFESAIELVLGH